MYGINQEEPVKQHFSEKILFLFILLPVFVFSITNANAQRRAVTIKKNSPVRVLLITGVLLATDDPSASRSLAWTNSYGKAKVVTILLEHDNQAWTNPDFVKLLTQAVFWVK